MGERRYRLEWAEIVVHDLADIEAYIAAESPASAERLMKRLRARVESLSTSPRRGRIVPELARWGVREWRELIEAPYRIVYRIDGRRLRIAAVLDGRRDLEDLLLARLIHGE